MFEQVDKRLDQIDRRLGQMDDRFRHMEKMLVGGVTFLSFLIALLRFVK